MAMRLSGLMSGMDTESIVQELVAVKQTKVDTLVKAQTKIQWKQDAWKELNNKIKKLFNGAMSNLRFESSYVKKTSKVSDSSVAEVIAGDSAMDSVQSLKVSKLAQTGYLTGAVVQKEDGSQCTSATKLSEMGIAEGSVIEITTGGKTTAITVEADMTLNGLTKKLADAGVNANFDSKTQRLFIGAKESGKDADFTLTAANDSGSDALSKLGILVYDDKSIAKYREYADMRTGSGTDDDPYVYTDSYLSIVDERVAARLTSLQNEEKTLNEELVTYQENVDKAKDAYAEAFGDADFEDLLQDAEDIKATQAKIKELEAVEEPTDEQAAELAELAELQQKADEYDAKYGDTLTEKLAAVAEYQSAEERVATVENRLADIKTYYETNADDEIVANDKLKDEIAAEVAEELTDKIDKAQAIIAEYDSLEEDETLAGSAATKLVGRDAEIYLNGAYFTSTDNTFEINGLTITCNAETGDKEVTITTQNDTSGIYDMIKDFIVEYSTLIAEMDKLYNADSASEYEPLTDEEKESMSESEVEKWETKIKDSLLRKDSSLNTVASAFRQIMASGFEVDGKTMYLSDFGIETLGYFEAADNERNVYHIDGDEDDEYVSTETNKLKAMISSNPEQVTAFFSQLAKSLYSKTSDLMKSVTGYSSSNTVYNDKKLQSDYDDYTDKIAEMEEKLADYEEKWYSKFAAMETAMAKMQNNANAVTSMLGG